MTTDEVLQAVDGLSVRDVCEIIQAAAASKVKALRFGALQLTFKETVDTAIDAAPRRTPPDLKPSRVPAKEAAKAEGLDRIEGLEREALELLAIEDPAAFEARLLSNDNVEGEDEADGDGA